MNMAGTVANGPTTDASCPADGTGLFERRLIAMAALFGILLLAGYLRLHNLEKESLWYDEWGSLCGMYESSYAAATRAQPLNKDMVPLFFFLEYHWAQFVNQDYTQLRFLPITFGMLAVLITYGIGRDMHSRTAGLLAALFLSLSPFAIRYSQELRPYSLALMLALVSMYCVNKMLEKDSVGWWALALCSNIALLWAHLFGFWLLIAQGVALLACRPDKWRWTTVWTVAHIALLMPLALHVLSWEAPGEPPLEKSLLFPLMALLFMDARELGFMPRFGLVSTPPEYADEVSAFVATMEQLLIPMAFAMSFLIFLVVTTFAVQIMRRDIHGNRVSALLHKRIGLLYLWYFAPSALLFAYSQLVVPAFQVRYVFYSLPAMYLIVVVAALSWRSRRKRWLVLGAMTVILTCFGMTATQIPLRPDHQAAIAHIMADYREGEPVFLHPRNPADTFRANAHDRLHVLESNKIAETLQSIDKQVAQEGRAWAVLIPWHWTEAPVRDRLFRSYCERRGIKCSRAVFPGMWDVYVYHCSRGPDFLPLAEAEARTRLRSEPLAPALQTVLDWVAANAAAEAGETGEAIEACRSILERIPGKEPEREEFEESLSRAGWHQDLFTAKQTEDLAAEAQRLVAKLQPGPDKEAAGESFRLDELVGQAEIRSPAAAPASAGGVTVLWPAQAPWHAKQDPDAVTVEGEELRLSTGNEDALTTPEGLDVYGPAVDAIEIEMSVTGPERVYLSWRPADTFWDWADDDGNLLAPINIPEQGVRQTYVIPVSELRGWEHRRIEGFRVVTREAAEIRLHRFAIRERQALFGDATHGVRKYRIGNETRPCLFVRTPGSLAYKVVVPRDAYLRMGLAIVDDNGPVELTCTVSSAAGDSERSWSVTSAQAWMDIEMALGEHDGHAATLTLQTSSEAPRILLLSNPVVVSGQRPPGQRPNILFYVVDSLRADHLSCYGYDRETSPSVDQLAREGILFERFHTQETCTKPSMATFSTGVDASVHGLICTCSATVGDRRQLPAFLREAGYVTGAVTENLYAPPEVPAQFTYSYLYDLDENTAAASGETFAHVQRFLDHAGNRPFFLYVHTMECHVRIDREFNMTYTAPPEFTGRWEEDGRLPNVDEYDETVLFADANFGRVLDALDARGLDQNTLVVFTSDHGQGFGAHRGRVVHGYEPFQELIHVPLVVRRPARQAGGTTVAENVQLLDLAPTFLDYAGIDAYPGFAGDSLHTLIEEGRDNGFDERPIYSYTGEDLSPGSVRSVIQGDWKLLGTPGRQRLYNIAEDPGETNDLRKAEPEVFARMKAIFDEHTAVFQQRRESAQKEEPGAEVLIQPETEERLRALGYLGGDE